MSEYCFNTSRVRVSREKAWRLDGIAQAVGGKSAGFTQITDPPFTGCVLNWFYCANRGEPFDSQTAAEIMAAVRKAGLE